VIESLHDKIQNVLYENHYVIESITHVDTFKLTRENQKLFKNEAHSHIQLNRILHLFQRNGSDLFQKKLEDHII